MKCRLIRDMEYGPSSGRNGETAVKGTVIDHADAWRLVQMGVAEPADEECDVAAGRMTAAQMQRAQHASLRAERGIIPEDFDAYDAGALIGYNADGTWIPGPNHADWEWEARKHESPIVIVED